MVHTGKPSTGCGTCRKRKVKCDETRPTCLQCSKSKRVCTGYRDMSETIFRSENDSTLQRVRRKDNAKKAKPLIVIESTIWPENGTLDVLDQSSDPNSALSYHPLSPNPQVSPEVCALNFYIDAMVPRSSSVIHEHTGHMVYIPQLYVDAAPDSALSYATKTVSLAAFSKFGGDQGRLASAAQQMYGKALKQVQEALKSPEQRMQNSTMMSIMIMITAESLLASTEAPLERWASHVGGMIGLLKMRGPDVVDDPIAARLFLVARSFMAKAARQNGVPLDSFFDRPKPDWEDRLSRVLGSAPFKLHQLSSTAIPLRMRTLAVLRSRKYNNDDSEIWSLLNDLEETDMSYTRWRGTLSEQHQYQVIKRQLQAADSCLKQNLPAWMTTTHLYSTARMARMWNDYRISRIFINAMILRCLKSLDTEADPSENMKVALHVDILQELVDDVCATIPDNLRPTPIRKGLKTSGSLDPPKDAVEEATTAYFLLWPLFVARGVLSTPEMQQNWIKACLLRIAEVYQIRPALTMLAVAAKDPKRPLEVDDWDMKQVENVWERAYAFGYGAM